MQNLPSSPLLLQIKTKILIEKKNVTLDHLAFNPSDNTDKLYEIVKNYFLNIGDEIEFADSYFCVIKKIYDNELTQKEILIEKGMKFLSLRFITGDVVILRGNFILKSDVPKSCITFEFEKNYFNKEINYFSCGDCNLNCK